MRLMRGSGLEGLSAMAASRTLTPGSKIKLVRPLLGVPKARLIATLEARGETWIDDPTNTRQDLERGRVRKFLGRLEDEGPAGEAVRRWRVRQSVLVRQARRSITPKRISNRR